MTKLELLNNIDHKNIYVISEHSAEYGSDVNGCLIFPAEFVEAHKEYPLYFQKDEKTGEFQAFVLFGFGQKENFFLDSTGWAASYIPKLMEKEPFYIGFQKNSHGESVPVVHIDVNSSRVNSQGRGNRLFLDSGEQSGFLKRVGSALLSIHEGLIQTKTMFDIWQEYDLIEAFTLDIVFDDNTKFQSEYYTINQSKLQVLDDEAIGTLHRTGYLQMAYFVLASLGNIKYLIGKRNMALKAQS